MLFPSVSSFDDEQILFIRPDVKAIASVAIATGVTAIYMEYKCAPCAKERENEPILHTFHF